MAILLELVQCNREKTLLFNSRHRVYTKNKTIHVVGGISGNIKWRVIN